MSSLLSGIFKSLRPKPQPAEAQADALAVARDALEAQDYAAAERSLADALRARPGDGDAAALMGIALARSGRPDEAIDFLRPRFKRRREHAGLRMALASAYIAAGHAEAALLALSGMLPQHAESADVRKLFERALAAIALHESEPADREWMWREMGCVLLALEEDWAAERCDWALAGPPAAGVAYEAFVIDEGLEAYCAKRGHALRALPEFKLDPPPGFEAKYRPVDSFVAMLPRGRVLGHSFIPAGEDGSAFIDRCIPNRLKHLEADASSVLDIVRLGSEGRILVRAAGTDFHPGRHVLLGSHENIGHWFYFHFGRLRLVDALPELAEAKFVVGDDLRPAAVASLARAGIAEDRVVRIPKGRFAQFEELWVPSLAFGGTPEAMFWNAGLARYIREKLGLAFPSAPKRRVFIGRKDARWRHLTNEAQVEAMLAAEGFETVDPGTLTLEEQVALAADIEILVSVFGAGTNLHLFCPERMPLIELRFDAQGQMDIHPLVAHDIGQRHTPIVGPIEKRAPRFLNSDFSVPVEAVRDEVRKALASR